jgi:hypothetical protein
MEETVPFPDFPLLDAHFRCVAFATGGGGVQDEVRLVLACITVAFARLLWTRWSYVLLVRLGFLLGWEGKVDHILRTL